MAPPLSQKKIDAFSDLYEREQPRIYAYALRRVYDRDVANDIVSETFEWAWGFRSELLDTHRFTEEGQHRYLLTIARIRVVRYWSNRKRRAVLTFSETFATVPEEQTMLLADNGGIDAIIEACDTAMAAALLRAALAKCTPTQLQIIEMRYAQHLPVSEVAARLGMTKQTYNKRHGLLMHHLAALLGGAPETERAQCAVAECDFPVQGRGLCNAHYLQWRAGADLPAAPPKTSPERCDECAQLHYSRGKCRMHYEALRRYERMEHRQAVVAGVL
jgi:RNA polymerase sigma factor (sigma-70 family)